MYSVHPMRISSTSYFFSFYRNEGKPDKPPNSGYSLFSKKLLSSDSLKQFETKERMTEISRLWKELGEAEKAAYNSKATQVNRKSLNYNYTHVYCMSLVELCD